MREIHRLVKDLGEDGFKGTFTCTMLANTGRIAKGVETELYDSGASCHMTTYRDQPENFVSIMPQTSAISKLMAWGICTLKFQMAR